MKLLDSRRLTGPNLFCDRPGAVIDISLDDGNATAPPPGEIVKEWERHAHALLDAVGWPDERVFSRLWPGGASLGITAPVDALYAATELNDRAWEATLSKLAGETREGPADVAVPDTVVADLRREIEAGSNPALMDLKEAAAKHGVTFLMDDEQVSVGLGAGSRTWPVNDIPSPAQVEWAEIHDIPLALVTGTNGKTTTVRLLAAIAKAAGRTAGNTSTDGVQVNGDFVLKGDYTGPEGARALLRDRRVELAVLEVARGGMLRRGLPVARADAALVTNVAPDHLGDYGIHDVEVLADAKMVVRRALDAASRLVLNADDPLLVKRADRAPCPVTWISAAAVPQGQEPGRRAAEPGSSAAHPTRGRAGAEGDLWHLQGESIIAPGCETVPFISVAEIPITFGGAARFNVYNVLGASALARALRLSDEAILQGLREFTGSSQDNVGRVNVYELGRARAIVDFAHNPHGLESVLEMVAALAPDRWLVTIGQAGDRDDQEIRDLARLARAAGPDRVVIKELPGKLRGRLPGEVPRLIEEELIELGFPAPAIEHADSDFDAVHRALRWAQDGDLLLLLLHEERGESLELLASLRDRGWAPGSPL